MPLADLERQPYDVLVTDYHMPSLNGRYLLTISRGLWPRLPVVMVSGEFGQVRADAIRQGAYAWLSKPAPPSVVENMFFIPILENSTW